MTFPVSFWIIVAFAWLASRAYQLINRLMLETPLTPAAAQAVFPRSAARKDVYQGPEYTILLTDPRSHQFIPSF
jgi:hypothetical protein